MSDAITHVELREQACKPHNFGSRVCPARYQRGTPTVCQSHLNHTVDAYCAVGPPDQQCALVSGCVPRTNAGQRPGRRLGYGPGQIVLRFLRRSAGDSISISAMHARCDGSWAHSVPVAGGSSVPSEFYQTSRHQPHTDATMLKARLLRYSCVHAHTTMTTTRCAHIGLASSHSARTRALVARAHSSLVLWASALYTSQGTRCAISSLGSWTCHMQYACDGAQDKHLRVGACKGMVVGVSHCTLTVRSLYSHCFVGCVSGRDILAALTWSLKRSCQTPRRKRM